jgi:hypothetical protein
MMLVNNELPCFISFKLGSSTISNPLDTQLVLMIFVLAWVKNKEDSIIHNPLVMVGLMFTLSLTTNTSNASKVEEGAFLCEEGVVGEVKCCCPFVLHGIPPKVVLPLTF